MCLWGVRFASGSGGRGRPADKPCYAAHDRDIRAVLLLCTLEVRDGKCQRQMREDRVQVRVTATSTTLLCVSGQSTRDSFAIDTAAAEDAGTFHSRDDSLRSDHMLAIMKSNQIGLDA